MDFSQSDPPPSLAIERVYDIIVLDLTRWEPGPSAGQLEATHEQPDLHSKASRTPPGENIIGRVSDLQVTESQHETQGHDDHGVMTIPQNG